MKKSIFSMILLMNLLVACEGGTSLPTVTPTSVTISTSLPQVLTNLPTGWKMDEHSETGDSGSVSFYKIYSLDMNYQYQTGMVNWHEYIDFNGHKLQVKEIEQLNSTIDVSLDDISIMSVECGKEGSALGYNLITYWTYENHWIVELICKGRQDIILDGQFLNATYGYSSSFSPYLVSGELFFFFKRDNRIGFFFDGKEYPLDFDDILYHHCCGIAELNPEFYGDKLTFIGLREEVRYYVIMGILDSH